MGTVKIRVDVARMTVRDLVQAESGFKGTTQMIDFLARFVTDDDGQYLDHAAAVERMMDVAVSDLPAITAQITAQVKALNEEAAPLVTADA